MTIVAILLTATNILDKWFVTGGAAPEIKDALGRALPLATGKCIMHGLFFAGLVLVRVVDWKAARAKGLSLMQGAKSLHWKAVWGIAPRWLVLAGVFEAIVLLLQLVAMQFAVAALVISIKRCGIVLAVILGRFVFHEKGITDRVIASCVMLSGVLIFFLTKPDKAGHAVLNLGGSLGGAALVLVCLAIALVMTHRPAEKKS